MVRPSQAGRPWTPAQDGQLRKLIASKIKVVVIAKKLKRSAGAVYARINSFKKRPRDLLFSAKPRSLPSERLAAYAKAEASELGREPTNQPGTACQVRNAPIADQIPHRCETTLCASEAEKEYNFAEYDPGSSLSSMRRET
jgi:hypothetical protein